jgi:hypothetical protein
MLASRRARLCAPEQTLGRTDVKKFASRAVTQCFFGDSRLGCVSFRRCIKTYDQCSSRRSRDQAYAGPRRPAELAPLSGRILTIHQPTDLPASLGCSRREKLCSCHHEVVGSTISGRARAKFGLSFCGPRIISYKEAQLCLFGAPPRCRYAIKRGKAGPQWTMRPRRIKLRGGKGGHKSIWRRRRSMCSVWREELGDHGDRRKSAGK